RHKQCATCQTRKKRKDIGYDRRTTRMTYQGEIRGMKPLHQRLRGAGHARNVLDRIVVGQSEASVALTPASYSILVTGTQHAHGHDIMKSRRRAGGEYVLIGGIYGRCIPMDHDDETRMWRELRTLIGASREQPTTALHLDWLTGSASRGNVGEEGDQKRANRTQE